MNRDLHTVDREQAFLPDVRDWLIRDPEFADGVLPTDAIEGLLDERFALRHATTCDDPSLH